MADREQYAQWLVNNSDKSNTPEFKVVADAYRAMNKPSLIERFKNTVNPPRENFPEYSAGITPDEALASELQLGDKNARLGQDKYGNPTLITERGTFYPNKPGLSVNDIRGFVGGVDSVAKDAAPYLAGGVAAAPAKAVVQMAIQGGAGLAQESIKQTGNAIQGKDVEWEKLATTPIFAVAGDAVGRVAYRVAAPVFTKILGSRPTVRIINSDGTLTDDAVRLLRASGTSADDFTRSLALETDNLSRTGVLTKEQAERFNFMRGQGVEPTTAQITRTADDFQLQQELAKRSTGVRGALENQEATIAKAFDDRILGAGGVTTGSPVSDAVLSKATILDDEISRLYGVAREVSPGAKNIRLGRYVEELRKRAPDNELTGGLVSSIRGDLIERGVMNDKFQVVGRIDVDTAETIRQVLGQRYKSTNDFGRQIIRQLKNELDDDVLSIAGQDVFKQARQAKASFESELRVDKLSKFDTNERSLVRDILDNEIKAGDVFDKVALGRGWKDTDLAQLKRYLTTGAPEQVEQGMAAWSSLRSETLDWIKQTAFTGPVDANGYQAVSRSGLERALKRIGDDKLKVIFTGDEVKFLNNMLKLSQLREPVRGTAMGRGPSAQAIEKMERSVLSRLPVAGQFYDFFKALGMIRADKVATEQMLNPASSTIQALTRAANTPATARQLSGAARGVSAYTGTEAQQ